jgi:hypothetical protein
VNLYRRTFGEWWSDMWVVVVTVTFLVVLFGSIGYAIYAGIQSDNRFVQQCHDQNGHTIDVGRGTICVGADGRYLGKN